MRLCVDHFKLIISILNGLYWKAISHINDEEGVIGKKAQT